MKNRFQQHQKGEVPNTRDRRPFEIAYCEISRNSKDTAHREKYLKTSWGKRYLKERLKNDFSRLI